MCYRLPCYRVIAQGPRERRKTVCLFRACEWVGLCVWCGWCEKSACGLVYGRKRAAAVRPELASAVQDPQFVGLGLRLLPFPAPNPVFSVLGRQHRQTATAHEPGAIYTRHELAPARWPTTITRIPGTSARRRRIPPGTRCK